MIKFLQPKCIRYNCRLFWVTYYSTNVRVRFAPSPTGDLHLGGLRTALYNYLFAKANNGTFILRIEDTDQSRLVDGAVQKIERDLKWFGIDIDEGPPPMNGNYSPYIQSHRLNIYKEHVNKLLENGLAYQCFCTEARLNLIRKEALRLGKIPKYDNNCRILSQNEINTRINNNEPYCIRFKISDDCNKFNDLIYGSIHYNLQQNEGDPVIMKSDGYPTYHFANVIDDHLMEISHVLRGVEWQISTVKHLLLYKAFEWKPPVFGHLPLLLNPDGKKLSKRQNDMKIEHFRNNNTFPLALLNMIILCGGGFDSNLLADPKIYSLDQLILKFDVNKIGVNSTKLMLDRLPKYNQLELKRQIQNESTRQNLIETIRNRILNEFRDEKNTLTSDQYLTKILEWAQNRITKIDELFSRDFLYLWFISNEKNNIINEHKELINLFRNDLNNLDNIDDKTQLMQFLKNFCTKNEIKYAQFMAILRLILTGDKKGPSVVEVIQILGKDDTLLRLRYDPNENIKEISI